MSIEVLTVNPEQAKRGLALCFMAERLAKQNGLPFTVPCVLVGPTGTSKSTSIREFARSLNGGKWQYWHNPLSLFSDTGDFGIPVPDMDKNVMRFLSHGNLPFGTEEYGVVNFDELDRSPDAAVAVAAGSLMLDREWHGLKLSPNCYVCGTMNGTSDIGTTPLAEFVRTRCCTLFLSRTAAGFTDSYDEWASKHGISAVARTFRKYRADLLAPSAAFEELAVCQDRTKDMADLILQASKRVNFPVDDILLPVLSGVIGRKAATEFIAIERLIADAPTIEDILRDPRTAKLPDNPSVLYALTCHIVGAAENLKAEREKLLSLITYVNRLPPEFAACTYRQAVKVAGAIATIKEFQVWAQANKQLLM